MRKVFTLAAIAAALTSTIGMARAAEPAEQRFVHDGAEYVYTVTPAPRGGQVIEGRRLSNGTPFRLHVANGRVRGTAGSTPVAFRLAEARGAAAGMVAVD